MEKVIFPITQNFLIKCCLLMKPRKALLEEEESMLLSVRPSPVITLSWGKRKKTRFIQSFIYRSYWVLKSSSSSAEHSSAVWCSPLMSTPVEFLLHEHQNLTPVSTLIFCFPFDLSDYPLGSNFRRCLQNCVPLHVDFFIFLFSTCEPVDTCPGFGQILLTSMRVIMISRQ